MNIKDNISHTFKEEEFNLNDYELIDIDSIEICDNDNEKTFIDINVEDDHSLYVQNNSNSIIFSQCDGAHIRMLYIAFFSKYVPSLVKDGKLCALKLPLICMKDVKGNIKEMFYTFDEYNEWNKNNKNTNLKCKYFKGLGSWKKDELKYIVSKYGVESLVEPFEYDPEAEKLIDDWVSKKKADVRKDYLKENEFNIFGI